MRRILGLLIAGFFMVTLAACGGGGSSKASFCNRVKELAANSDSLEATFSEAFTDSDPKKLDAANAMVQDLAGKAPSDIKADAKLLADTVKKAVDALKGAGNDPAKKLAALAPLAAEQSKLEDATNRIDDYTQKQCGITLQGADSTDSSSSSSSSKSSSSSSSDDGLSDTESLNSVLSSLSSYLSDTDLSDDSDLSSSS